MTVTKIWQIWSLSVLGILQDLGQECLSASLQVCKLENVGVAVEGNVMATTGIMKPLSLPDNLTATSAETIASLNDHLIVTLQVSEC